MSFYVDPVSDIFFRFLMSSEGNEPILMDFINAVLEDSGFPPAEDITITNPFNLVTIAGGKESILDVKARDARNRQFDVEIQVQNETDFPERTLFYWAKLYSGQLATGDKYDELKPVICINILDFPLFPELSAAHNCFLLLEMREKNVVLSNQIQIHFFELSKMDLEGQTRLPTRLEKWAYFFKKEGKADDAEVAKLLLEGDSIMQKAHENYQKFTMEDQYRELYEAREKARKDEASRNGQARREGREEGLAESVCRLKKHGFSEEKIAEVLELSRSDVEAYLKQ